MVTNLIVWVFFKKTSDKLMEDWSTNPAEKLTKVKPLHKGFFFSKIKDLETGLCCTLVWSTTIPSHPLESQINMAKTLRWIWENGSHQKQLALFKRVILIWYPIRCHSFWALFNNISLKRRLRFPLNSNSHNCLWQMLVYIFCILPLPFNTPIKSDWNLLTLNWSLTLDENYNCLQGVKWFIKSYYTRQLSSVSSIM